MTSKLAREENVQAVFDLKAGYTLGLADVEILKRVARIALAAMDSEPVAWRWRWSDDVEGYWRYTEEQRETHGSVTAQPLYRHAQPAPVVPVVPECFVRFHDIIKERHHGRMPEEVQNAFDECAAMLQAGNSPVIPDGLIAAVNRLLDSDGSRGVIARSAATTHVRK
ncbi:hypothetical protein ACNHKA_19215 [Klebsiella michiganensis]